MKAHFINGDQVEVAGASSNTVSYFTATVLRATSARSGMVLVERRAGRSDCSELVKENVELSRVRPVPPRELNRWFKVGDKVDAYGESDGCWVRGSVREILENSRCRVQINGAGAGEIEVHQFNLRIHREWDGDSWIPPLEGQNNLSETVERRKLKVKIKLRDNLNKTVETPKLKVKIKFTGRKPAEKFQKGTTVEVRCDKEGYKGSWYSALVVDYIGNERFIMEYLTLKTDDESRPLREEITSEFIRPFPPQCLSVTQFKPLDEVDAWHNEGWWEGTICRVLRGLKYIVHLSSSNEDMEFKHSDLRPHQDWINGKWATDFKGKSNDQFRARKCNESKPNERKSKGKANPQFPKGMKIEVKSDEEGYEGAWYAAIIINSTRNDKYIVEYQTLKTDDETELLMEEAKASDIRPCPPPVQRVYPYKLFDYVDAWYNDGWWLGQIFKIHAAMRYVVYFKTSNEYLKFAHSDLRPHHEWVNGDWIAASKVPEFDDCMQC